MKKERVILPVILLCLGIHYGCSKKEESYAQKVERIKNESSKIRAEDSIRNIEQIKEDSLYRYRTISGNINLTISKETSNYCRIVSPIRLNKKQCMEAIDAYALSKKKIIYFCLEQYAETKTYYCQYCLDGLIFVDPDEMYSVKESKQNGKNTYVYKKL
jgi:hypothetical protein